jgi:hypothetical protein
VTNAQIATLRFANRALVTSGNGVGRYSGGLPSAARRRRCAPTPFPPSLRLRSTVSSRQPQTEAGTNDVKGLVATFANVKQFPHCWQKIIQLFFIE